MRRGSFFAVFIALTFGMAMVLAGCGGNASPAPNSSGGPAAGNGSGSGGSGGAPSGGSGSGGSGGAPTGGSGGSGSGGGAAGAPTAEYVYTSGTFTDNIWGFRFDPITGTLTALPGFPVSPASNTTAHALCDRSCGATYRPLIGDPLGKYLFEDAAGAGGGAMVSFTVDPSSGALTQDDALAGFDPFVPHIDPQGRFIARDIPGPNQTTLLNIVAIDRSNGHLSQAPGSPYAIPTGSNSSVSTNGPAVSASQVYDDVDVRGGGDSSLYGYNVGSNLALTQTPGSPYDSGNSSFAVAMHPSGKWVYVQSMTFPNGVGITQYQEYIVNSDGSLAKTGNPVVTNATGGFMTFAANGKFALVDDAASAPTMTAQGTSGLSVYAVDQSTGALTKLQFYPNLHSGFVSDATGNWLFYASGQATINVYRIDANSGVLTKQGSAAVPVDTSTDDNGAIAVVAPR